MKIVEIVFLIVAVAIILFFVWGVLYRACMHIWYFLHKNAIGSKEEIAKFNKYNDHLPEIVSIIFAPITLIVLLVCLAANRGVYFIDRCLGANK